MALTPANTPDRDAIDELPAGEAPDHSQDRASNPTQDTALTVMGDSAYADGPTLERLGAAGHTVMAKVPPARNATGGFAKDRFDVDLDAATVNCPAGNTVPIVPVRGGAGRAAFGKLRASCPLQAQCTKARAGRVGMVPRRGRRCRTPGPRSAPPSGRRLTGRSGRE